MKKIYTTPIMMTAQHILRDSILSTSKPHINDDGNVEFPGGGEGGDADDGCAKEINEMIENDDDPFDKGLW